MNAWELLGWIFINQNTLRLVRVRFSLLAYVTWQGWMDFGRGKMNDDVTIEETMHTLISESTPL
jgi:hypothetical protein